jgi:hypothetical protein
MEADRARIEEVMAEERALWDQERDFLKGRIEELESQIAALFGHQSLQQGPLDSEISPGNSQGPQQLFYHTRMTPSAPAGSNGNSAKLIRQESGRNPDGSPFYAPAPRNPSRTFEAPQNDALRVDSMSAPRETPIRITSKELTESDFGLRSSSAEGPSRSGSESIDISHLQPELEGVPIKTSAISPAFVAQVMSPNSSLSPPKPSSHVSSPPQRQDIKAPNGLGRTGSQAKKSTLEVIAAPETHRLTMNAGHTPNHSIHKLDLGDSGGATPTQDQHRLHNPQMAISETEQHVDENIDPDPELQGPLGLKNDPPKDELFLAALTNKLREVKESGLISPSEMSVDSEDQNSMINTRAANAVVEKQGFASVSENFEDDDSKSAEDEAPILRVKASMNFGRPFGSL